MATVQQSELAEFYEYLGKHVRDPLPHPMPEDVLEAWRVQRGDLEDFESDVEAIRAALNDLDQGDQGTDARQFVRDLEASLLRKDKQ